MTPGTTTDAGLATGPVTSILWLATGPVSVTGEQAIDKVVSGAHPVADEMLWIHLERASTAEVQALADRFKLDSEAVEDLLAEHERPKLDVGPGGTVVVSRGAHFDIETGEIHSYPISAIVTRNVLVTIADGHRLLPKLNERLRKKNFLPTGASMLYQLVDQIVDEYAQSAACIADAVDQLTEKIFGEHSLSRDEQLQAFRLRRSLTQMRRVIVPTRDLTSTLASMANSALKEREAAAAGPDGRKTDQPAPGRQDPGRQQDGQPEVDQSDHDQQDADRWDSDEDPTSDAMAAITWETARGFTDVAEHVAHGSDAVDALREVMGSLMETNLSLADVQLNTVMKKLASWAALIAVPTLITGFMGMNVPYPGFSQTAGFVGALVVMIIAFAVLIVLFRRKNWL